MPLYLVSTPIGNREDITLRALRILKEADLIAAEDTRVTGLLLKHFEFSRPMISYFEQNERKRVPQLLEHLREGKSVALVTNAGTPGVSDPGFLLVRSCIEEEIPVIPIPGPSAHTAGLVASGLPVHEFWFRGFPPKKKGKRDRFLAESAECSATLIFYESPYRIRALVEACLTTYGDRRCAVCRELTKKFEEIQRGKLSEVLLCLDEKKPRGEFVLLVEGKTETD